MITRTIAGRRGLAVLVLALVSAGSASVSWSQTMRGVAPRYGAGLQRPARAARAVRPRAPAQRVPAGPITELFDPLSSRAMARSYAQSRRALYQAQLTAARLAERSVPGQHWYLRSQGRPGSANLRLGRPLRGGPVVPVGLYWPASYPALIGAYGLW